MKASVKKTVRGTVFSEGAEETIHKALNPSDENKSIVRVPRVLFFVAPIPTVFIDFISIN